MEAAGFVVQSKSVLMLPGISRPWHRGRHLHLLPSQRGTAAQKEEQGEKTQGQEAAQTQEGEEGASDRSAEWGVRLLSRVTTSPAFHFAPPEEETQAAQKQGEGAEEEEQEGGVGQRRGERRWSRTGVSSAASPTV